MIDFLRKTNPTKNSKKTVIKKAKTTYKNKFKNEELDTSKTTIGFASKIFKNTPKIRNDKTINALFFIKFMLILLRNYLKLKNT